MSALVISPRPATSSPAPALTSMQEFLVGPQARALFKHLQRTGSISAREAALDYDITSATLSRRICDLEEIGVVIRRDRRRHPVKGTAYTRYVLMGNSPAKVNHTVGIR